MKTIMTTDEYSAGTVTIPCEEYDSLMGFKAQNAELTQKLDWLLEQLRLSKKRQFGQSSEQTQYDIGEQLSLLFNEAEFFADENVQEPPLQEIQTHYRKKSKELKDRLPEDLPVDVVEHRLPEEERLCPACGTVMQEIGKDVRRTLVIVPAQVKIREDWYYTYACQTCKAESIETPVLETPKDKSVISGSFASPEAVAHLMTQKFVMGSPLHRQSQEWQRHGIPLSKQTMSNWLLRCSEDWLEPLYEELHRQICGREVLHADETTLQVLHEPGKTAQSKSYMWLYRTSGDAEHPIVLYEYQPDRKACHPENFLTGFHGFLHADGYQGYHKLPMDIAVVGCWAHARRKFDEALNALPKEQWEGSLAMQGKSYCDRLFALEKQLADCSAVTRREERSCLAKPILEKFLLWAKTCKAAPKSALGKAIHYLQEQWSWLTNYLLDGRLELSNNRAERSIKPFVIDRKNFLFANTTRGAKSSAVIFSIIETAKENGLEPYRYLTYILKIAPNLDLAAHPERVSLLLPQSAPDECKPAASLV